MLDLVVRDAGSGLKCRRGFLGDFPDGPDDAMEDGSSVQALSKLVMRLILALRKFPDASECLPDSFKKDLARSIKAAKKVCPIGSAVSNEAQNQIKQACVLYRQLSGASYL